MVDFRLPNEDCAVMLRPVHRHGQGRQNRLYSRADVGNVAGMYVLGFSCYTHDAAAALLHDGTLVTAAEEERFNRRKHTSAYPVHAIEHCLATAGISLGDVEHVGFHFRPWPAYPAMARHWWRHFPRSLNLVRERWAAGRRGEAVGFGALYNPPAVLGAGRRTRRLFASHHPRFRFHFLDHHLCHHAGSFFVSPFEEAASLSIDGCGEWTTAMTTAGRGNRLEVLRRVAAPHSLGMLYNSVCEYLGFSFLEGPGKVMGLAPYGDPDRYHQDFEKTVILLPDGTFRLDFRYFDFHVSLSRKRYSRFFESTFGPPRRPETELTQRHMDIAAALQRRLEEAALHMAEHLQRQSGMSRLCLSGGVVYNSVMNATILKKGIFDEVFIQPAAGDAGCAMGAAWYIEHALLDRPRAFRFEDACVGSEFSDEQVRQSLERRGAPYTRTERPAVDAAALLAAGRIIGWFQGRAEIGPRALGSRSILSAPFPAEMRDRLNSRVKHREAFRPFAPSVLEEKMGEYFDGPAPSPFMLLVYPVRAGKRDRIPAVTHVDGSARVQTVSRRIQPLYYALIEAFEQRTGIPVVLNTSFNVRGMPIVNSPDDALDCFEATEMDAVILGNYVVSSRNSRGR